MSDKIYVAYAEDATEPMSVFLLEVIYSSDIHAMVQIWERGSYPGDSKYKIDSPVERDDFKEAIGTVEKKFSGCVEVRLSSHWCCSVPGKQIGLMLDAAAFICDQVMAEERVDINEDGTPKYSWGTTFEQALGEMNCNDGADENPGIVYRDLADEGEFVPTPMKAVTYYVPGSPWGIVMYEEEKDDENA